MAYISKSFIDKIHQDGDLVKLLDAFLPNKLQPSGANFKTRSPFNDDKTASFLVSPAKGIWKCYSSGKGGNSVVSFLMQYKGLEYPEAIEAVAKAMHLEVTYDDTKMSKAYQEKQEKKQALQPLLNSSVNNYHQVFLNLDNNHPAKREVYVKRGYTDEIVEKYQIGFAPKGRLIYDLCKDIARLEDAKSLGIVGDYGDKYQDRVIYPIVTNKGATNIPVGMAGRYLGAEKKYAKWINSAESILYNKSKVWYGLEFAKEEIVKTKTAYIVEGYNDVISWQTNALLNTISPCGTAIALDQILLLRKFCDKVILCLDPDKAGRASAIKHIPLFLIHGFRVEILELPDTDPDDFVRVYKKELLKDEEFFTRTILEFQEDGFALLIKEQIQNKKQLDKSKNAKVLCKTIEEIPDDSIKIIYSEWLSKESGVKITQIKNWIKEFEAERKALFEESNTEVVLNSDSVYVLPHDVKESVETLRPTIEKYQMFQANNQIWMQTNFDEPPFRFKSVSNFSIDIIQHMQDEKFPMKLIRIKNIFNKEKIFDIQSEAINTPMAFDNAVTAHGNFLFKGGRNEHQKLRAFLFDRMGTGRKIDVLGWQPEGFWCWNNQVDIPGKEKIDINDNGVFKFNEISYYVPSANDIYKQNAFKYEAQKKIMCMEPQVTFTDYTAQVIKVHRNHGITGILFSIASAFQDIVTKKLGNFPMLFLYGPASSGKDQLAEICQGFFGHPQTAINLEGGVSTIKAQVREFAQFCNMISHLSEYKNGDSKLDGVLKGLWDRRGYKRGNIDSHVGTESIPILSSVILTGNYTPDAEALITRLVWEEMSKTVFDDEEIKEYDKLIDMTKNGISGFTTDIVKHRNLVEKNFTRVFRELKATLGERMPEAKSRMISNAAVLCTFYQLFQNELIFPFSLADVMTHFQKGIDVQTRKLNTASIVNRWWDCFLASMRGTLADQLRVGRDFKIEGDRIYFNYTNSYNKIQRQWFTQYKDNAPGKTVMKDALVKEQSYIDDVKSVRMGKGAMAPNTSACVFNINTLQVAEELKYAVEFQNNENSLFGNQETPATPDIFNDTMKDFLELDD